MQTNRWSLLHSWLVFENVLDVAYDIVIGGLPIGAGEIRELPAVAAVAFAEGDISQFNKTQRELLTLILLVREAVDDGSL
jgi:hypothetical protein